VAKVAALRTETGGAQRNRWLLRCCHHWPSVAGEARQPRRECPFVDGVRDVVERRPRRRVPRTSRARRSAHL